MPPQKEAGSGVRIGAAFVLRAAATLLAALVAFDIAFLELFPSFPRLAANFSAAYLARQARALGREHPVVTLGDSALWGYRVSVEEAAITRLRRADRRWVNLSYEGGSAPNTFALLRILDHAGVAPHAVVFNVNLKEFNPVDSAYDKLYPGVERLAWPLLSAEERAKLKRVTPQTVDAKFNETVELVWPFYAMRSDVRAAMFADQDAAHAVASVFENWGGTTARKAAAHRPTPAKFEGTYDLSPLGEDNTGVFFLRRIARALQSRRISGYAILTPTNHKLLHDYIDVPEYRAQLLFVTRLLRSYGITVLDYDSAFAPAEFLDNDHLTVEGNRHLAQLLSRDVAP